MSRGPQPSEELLRKHYDELKNKAFFPGLVKFMSSGPVVAMVSCPWWTSYVAMWIWYTPGMGGTGRGQDGPEDAWRDQPGMTPPPGHLCAHGTPLYRLTRSLEQSVETTASTLDGECSVVSFCTSYWFLPQQYLPWK